MSELKPTKARLALLRAVDDGAVTMHYGLFPSRDYVDWDRGPGWKGPGRRYQTVTGKANELRDARWIRLGKPESDHYKASRPFEVTEVGRAVLESAS